MNQFNQAVGITVQVDGAYNIDNLNAKMFGYDLKAKQAHLMGLNVRVKGLNNVSYKMLHVACQPISTDKTELKLVFEIQNIKGNNEEQVSDNVEALLLHNNFTNINVSDFNLYDISADKLVKFTEAKVVGIEIIDYAYASEEAA